MKFSVDIKQISSGLFQVTAFCIRLVTISIEDLEENMMELPIKRTKNSFGSDK